MMRAESLSLFRDKANCRCELVRLQVGAGRDVTAARRVSTAGRQSRDLPAERGVRTYSWQGRL